IVIAGGIAPSELPAQLISLKTVPVPNGEQFLLLPSRNLGMGGLSLALEDPLADVFVNPAKGARLEGGRVFSAPAFYDVSDDLGGGASLPLGAVLRSGRWFGGTVLAMQQLQDPNTERIIFDGVDDRQLRNTSRNNTYARIAAGMTLGHDGRTSIGAAILHASLAATDGASLLFRGADYVLQDGGVNDYRVGVLHELDNGGWLEAVVVHNRLDMTHDVAYTTWTWNAGDQSPVFETREETNLDRTRTTGVHLAIVHPLAEPGWRIGGALTFNRKMHPKIPNYALVNIPRDPGNSTAFNAGVGLSRTDGPTVFAMDLVWEPARSHTWAEAGDRIVTASGSEIPSGGRTIENWFRFSNIRFATGMSHESDRGGFQLGLGVKMYDYRLRQENYVSEETRRTNDSWFEWTPSWGAVFKRSGVELRYTGRITMRGLPLLDSEQVDFIAPLADAPDILAAPTAPVTLPDYHTFTNQLSVSFLIGGRR
ncbi:MAG: hypothetical protein ACRELX_08785, partial [Longimicrobiales bacterium]